MMFEPFTYGYEWETHVLGEGGLPVANKHVEELAWEFQDRYPWSRTGIDFIPVFGAFLLEIRSGILRSFDELRDRTLEPLSWLRKTVAKKGWHLLTLGSHPALGAAACVHVHCGTEHSFSNATALANEMSAYAPAFAALMANSPLWGIERGDYKSYRVQKKAEYCSRPRAIQSPGIALSNWGEDVSVKVAWKPTIEVRIADSGSSSEIVTEYVLFLAAFAYGLSTRERRPLAESEFLESLRNRFRAAKYGLQAVFEFRGEDVPVSELLERMIETSGPGFETLGASPSDLGTIRTMIEKRQTQSDFWSYMWTHYDDPLSFAVEAAAMMERESPLEVYLENAPVLSPLRGPEFRDAVLESIDRNTSYTTLSEVFSLPHFELEKTLGELEREGRIRADKSLEEPPRYSRRRRRTPRRSP